MICDRCGKKMREYGEGWDCDGVEEPGLLTRGCGRWLSKWVVVQPLVLARREEVTDG